MPFTRVVYCSVLGLLAGGAYAAAETMSGSLTIAPGSFVLRGRTSQQRLLVMRSENGRTIDGTRAASFRSDSPAIVRVSSEGIVTPVGDGTATITASLGGRQGAVRPQRPADAPGQRSDADQHSESE